MDGGSCRPRREGLEEVGGCLQLLDLRSERTSHCVDSEEAGNNRTHQMHSRNILDKNSYLGQFAHGCESFWHKSYQPELGQATGNDSRRIVCRHSENKEKPSLLPVLYFYIQFLSSLNCKNDTAIIGIHAGHAGRIHNHNFLELCKLLNGFFDKLRTLRTIAV